MDNRNELMAEIAKLQSENEALKAKQHKAPGITFKVSEKKGVSAYGLNVKFPVSLYKDQWLRLLDKADELRQFIAAHESELAVKAQKK